jgi:hypothetical protein
MADAAKDKDKDHAEELINVDDIKMQLKSAIAGVLEEQEGESTLKYDHTKSAHWITRITESVMDKCMRYKKPYKYVVNAVIVHKAGAGVHICSSAHFSQQDGIVSDVFDMNETLYCAVTLYWCAL